jgi:hypothetical protein
MALRNGPLRARADPLGGRRRAPDGGIRVASGRKTVRSGAATRVPIARGRGRMSEMLAILPQVKRELPEARLAFENPTRRGAVDAPRSRSPPAPRGGGDVARRRRERSHSALAVLPALAMLRSSSLARYHGAEHKTIGAYESGGDGHDEAKEHDRCGSHLVTPLVALSLAGNVLASTGAPRAPRGRRAGASLPRWASPSSCSAGRRATPATRWRARSAPPAPRCSARSARASRPTGAGRGARALDGCSSWRAER